MLHLHRAERADRLVDALADVLAAPLDDPMTTELVAVHSRGIERWLAQELSARLGAGAGRRDGVCANVDFPFPGRIVGRALAAAGGGDPDADPWSPERLVWPLLEVVDDHLDEAWLGPLRAHLGGSPATADPTRRGRRFGAARHLADLFDRYGVHRPAMLRAWAEGCDVDVSGAPIGGDAGWQPRLWRAVHDRVGVASPAERLDDAVRRLREGVDPADLPARVSLFGLTALPASYLAVVSALATTRDVHLFLLHPSPVLWRRVAEAPREGRQPARREADRTRGLARHPLLASWGRDAREMGLVVTAGVPLRDHHLPGATPAPTTLLERIQADVRADRAPVGPPLPGRDDRRPPLAAGDRSLQVHSCHGRTRQVEVLRDAILHLLADDPSLEPRDVVVMCPDIETFAPLIHAVFGAHANTTGDDLPDLRVRIADRSIRQTNPVLRVVAELLGLADDRVTASQVLDLAAREPVRRRFRFDDEDLTRLETWVADAGIRWGLDAGHRASFGLGGISANTWRAGLDRLLAGVTMADEEQRLVGSAVPLDDVEGDDVDRAGRFAELVDRLGAALTTLRARQPVSRWRDRIAAAAAALTATGERDRWQRLQLHRLLDDVVAEATTDGVPSPVELALPEVRALLEDRLRGRPSRANHRTGDLTFCTLVPMRSVPHRVVCLLGMDDGDFPRRTAGDGDDLIDRDPHVGDRDARTEDRQLLLDALLAAGDHLLVTYTGCDERSNEPQPPAVPVGELLDVARRTVRGADGGEATGGVVVQHPLQPFDPRNFRAGALVAGRPWGFDATALAGARTLASGTTTPAPFLGAPLDPPADADTIQLDQLVRFFDHPVKAFLRQRLGVSLPGREEEPGDAIPVELGALDFYALGDRLLATRLGGGDVGRWADVERARGVLPPGALADEKLAELIDTVEALLRAAGTHVALDRERTAVPVDVPLPDGRRLVGAVADVVGDVVFALRFARVKAKPRLAAWVRLLAATAACPGRPLSAVTVGRCRRSGRSKEVTVARIAPLADSPDDRRRRALHQLAALVDLYERGLRAPLPVYCATSAAYAEAVDDGGDATAAAEKEWATGRGTFDREDRDPGHRLVLGCVQPFAELLGEPPRADERGEGWAGDETSRFGVYARRLWDGLLAHEEVQDC
ncbi:exodeoxyribonuclease V subunit gamma [soil metagenome]